MSFDVTPLRFSHLRAISQSPAHCRYAMTRDDDEQTAAMARGTALHAILFENRRVIVPDDHAPNKPTKPQRAAVKKSAKAIAAIAYWDDFVKRSEGAIILTAGKMNAYQRMAEAIRADSHAMEVLKGAQEHTLRYKLQGRDCRSTPDVRADDSSYLTDLKSTVTSDPERFKWQANKKGIVAQLAWYGTACDVLFGKPPEQMYIVGVEAVRPHVVTVFRLTDADKLRGQKQTALWFERFMSCEASNQWPGYAQGIVDLDLPDSDAGLDWSGVDAAEESEDDQ